MALAVALLLALGLHNGSIKQRPQEVTLRAVLARHQVPADGLPDADRAITSYATASTDEWFGVAYYWSDGAGLGDLHVRTRDTGSGRWRHATFTVSVRKGGSAVGFTRQRDLLYLDLHVSPSAGSLLILRDSLELLRQLDGWSARVLADGRVVYQNNLAHFAPAHPGTMSLYDPRRDQDVRLYPQEPDRIVNGRWIDRTFGAVEEPRPGTVRLSAIEQDVRIGKDDRGIPEEAPRYLSIACALSDTEPRCTVEPASQRDPALLQRIPDDWIDLPEAPFVARMVKGQAALVNRTNRSYSNVLAGCVADDGGRVVVLRGVAGMTVSDSSFGPGAQVEGLLPVLNNRAYYEAQNASWGGPTMGCPLDARLAVIAAEGGDYRWSAEGTRWRE